MSPRAQQIAARIAAGAIPTGEWWHRIRDDIWATTPPRCRNCRRHPLHLARGLTSDALARFCPNCDTGGRH